MKKYERKELICDCITAEKLIEVLKTYPKDTIIQMPTSKDCVSNLRCVVPWDYSREKRYVRLSSDCQVVNRQYFEGED